MGKTAWACGVESADVEGLVAMLLNDALRLLGDIVGHLTAPPLLVGRWREGSWVYWHRRGCPASYVYGLLGREGQGRLCKDFAPLGDSKVTLELTPPSCSVAHAARLHITIHHQEGRNSEHEQ